MTHCKIISILLALSVALSACGGGGGSAAPPAAPSLTLAFGIKQLQFTWDAVTGATHYKLYENADGVSGFTQIGSDLTATTATLDIAVHRHDWANARYLVEACNSAGCTGSNEVNTLGAALQAIGYIKASNTGAGDDFGWSVALSADGNTLAVGATSEESNATGVNGDQANNGAPGAGAVYVYSRSNGTWTQQAYVKASNTEAFDNFGSSVALNRDGNTLAVGAPGESSNGTGPDDNSAPRAGAVYIYTRTAGTWAQQAYIKASNANTDDQFGTSLAISGDGNALAVGAPFEDGNGTDPNDNTSPDTGAVYIYTRAAGLWTQRAYVKASNADAADSFGFPVALSSDGNTLAVGAVGEDGNGAGPDDDSAPAAGAVYVYNRSNGAWTQQAYVKSSHPDTDDLFGFALALSSDGNTLAVGALFEDGNGNGTGPADNSAPNAGAAYVYTRASGVWTQQAYLKASNAEAFDQFGGAVALSGDGDTLAVGATGEKSNAVGINGDQADNSAGAADDGAGAVYVYTVNAGTWTQQAYVKASNTDAFDEFGASVALNGDGNTLAVSAIIEDSNATGVNGDQTDNSADAGAVYLY